MTTQLDPKDQFKSRTDLWIHCNNLMWSRLQPLFFIQAAYFAVAAYLAKSNSKELLLYAFLITLLFLIYLTVVVFADRTHRDRHGMFIYNEYGIDLLNYEKNDRKTLLSRVVGCLDKTARAVILYGLYYSWAVIDLLVMIYLYQ